MPSRTALPEFGPLEGSAFGPAALELMEVRAPLRHVEKMAATAQDWLKAYHAVGADTIHGRRALRVSTQHREPYLRFNTERLKREKPGIYARARVLKPYTVISREGYAPALGTLYGEGLPGVPKKMAPDQLLRFGVPFEVAHAEKMRLRPILADLRRREAECKDALEWLCEPYLKSGQWDGTQACFADGYRFGIRAIRFDADTALLLLDQVDVPRYSQIVAATDVEVIQAVDPDAPVSVGGPDAFPFEGD